MRRFAERSIFPALIFTTVATARAVAGPPFLTDDPVPTDYQHYEIYTYVNVEKNAGIATTTTGPSLEFNWGALRNVQISATLPYTFLSTSASPAALVPDTFPGTTVSGFGDTEFAVKYRFLQEAAGRPQISFYPAIEIPTGNSATGIGNGRTWYRFPVWIQKSWGRWATYGGGGYAIDTASDQKNYPFGGWLVQRDFSENVTVGAEIYSQGAQFTGDKATAFYNAGTYITLTKNFGILFSLGHSFSGDDESVAYFAFGFTGPFGKSAALLDAARPQPEGAGFGR